jgi:phosphate butyryltransferase
MRNFDELFHAVKDRPTKRVAAAAAADPTVVRALSEARHRGIAEPILVGPVGRIAELAREYGQGISADDVIDEPDPIKAADVAVRLVHDGKADILMKGHIHTDDFLRALLDKDHGLRSGVRMSHVFILDYRSENRLLFITDAAMNIAPDLETKAEIVLNAVGLAHAFGFDEPRVACLAAVELLNPAMPATVEATCLHKMYERGQFSPSCIIDGPFALDNAVSEAAAKHKHIEGPVAGKADILLVPDIEAGNMLAKAFVYFAGGSIAGVVIGASAPVVLSSRADSAGSKLASVAAAVYLADSARALSVKIGKVHY